MFSLYELDWDVFGVHIDSAVNRCPTLGTTGIRSTVCGPESFTPDHKPLLGIYHTLLYFKCRPLTIERKIGEEPTLRGFYHGCGFNSAGMMFGGGCGWQLVRFAFLDQFRPVHSFLQYALG